MGPAEQRGNASTRPCGEAGAALLAGAGCYRAGRWLRAAVGRRALIWVPGVIVCLCVLVLQLAPQHRVRTPGSRR